MNLNQMNILLAEDDQDDCYFFEKALKELATPALLTTVSDGDQLMNYLSVNSDHLPNVLFLDLNMPRKNGFDCLSEIKQNSKLKNLPLVILSTSNSTDAINKVFRSGAHIYIRKPADFNQLKQVIKHALPIVSERKFSTNKVKYILNA
jgi:CheY-like chemotaxis protein